MEFADEDLIHLDELKKYFENDNLPELKESKIHILGKFADVFKKLNELLQNNKLILLYIELYISFLMGRKRTVNF